MNAKLSTPKPDDASPEHPKAMRIPKGAPAGIELDNHGNPIPLAERTAESQEKVDAIIEEAIAEISDPNRS